MDQIAGRTDDNGKHPASMLELAGGCPLTGRVLVRPRYLKWVDLLMQNQINENQYRRRNAEKPG